MDTIIKNKETSRKKKRHLGANFYRQRLASMTTWPLGTRADHGATSQSLQRKLEKMSKMTLKRPVDRGPCDVATVHNSLIQRDVPRRCIAQICHNLS
jgi:hypothetical protein